MRKKIFVIAFASAILIIGLVLVTMYGLTDLTARDHIEIERKFLVDRTQLPADNSYLDVAEYIQTYLSYEPESRVRKITDTQGTRYYYTQKFPEDQTGLSRREIEMEISLEEYEEYLKNQVGSTIYKTRYKLFENGYYMFLDVYSDDLSPLAVVEVEFSTVEKSENFIPPSWFGEDVTTDLRYKNANLSKDGLPE